MREIAPAARHDREMAEYRKGLADGEARGHRTDRRLDRAIKLGVRELRNERRRRQEMDARWQRESLNPAAHLARNAR